MSEPKLISPLLDGITMGHPMSSHDGVHCFPAIKENSDDKYIVKVISVPASQVQLEALLLTGAYKDSGDAMAYFKELADGVVREAEQLQSLAKLDGFLAYDAWQVVPMEEGQVGYQVYLRSPYKRSLERYMRRSLLTHLEAVNLGLDMCAALAVCRRAGMLYVDLKPSNIFLSRDKSYQIGDLGFVAMDALKFTSLPGKYRSPYSPPEVCNDLNTLNDTVDIYALGMILYQIYNDGALPAPPKELDEPFPSPANADYEIAEIILKAVAPAPKDRWQDPMAMGQALVAYMQRNGVNNTPIKPPSLMLDDTDLPALMADPFEEEPDFPEVPVLTAEDVPDTAVSGEVSDLVAQAEDLISHEVPVSVVIPEEVPLPDITISVETDETEDPQEDLPEELPVLSPQPKRVKPARKPIGTKWIAPALVLLVLALLSAGVFWFYQNVYLQTIDSLALEGTQDQLIVTVDTSADHSLLTVACFDTYGNTQTKPLQNGQAVFTDLLPNSQYKVQLQISGFHKLVGETTNVFNTEAVTSVLSIAAITGTEDGSMMLNLTVEGPEPEGWMLTGVAPEEDVIVQSFSGHNVVIRDLSVGKEYTFYLSADGNIDLRGQTSFQFIASRLVTAEDLSITAFAGEELRAAWTVPENSAVDIWTVRCYGGSYDETQKVTETEVIFSGLDPAQSYTVEVTAAGMTTPVRTSITPDPITITALMVDDQKPGKLTLTWDFVGTAPEGGWLLMYSMDDSLTQSVVKCDKPTAQIDPCVPGAVYHFTIQAADSRSIFGSEHIYICPNPEIFASQALSAQQITGHLLKTPEGEWSFETQGRDAFSDTFRSGDKLSLVLEAAVSFYLKEEDISILYVFRDAQGNVLPDLILQDSIDWKELWLTGDYQMGELDIPKAPTETGEYSLSLYFNHAAVLLITFTITE